MIQAKTEKKREKEKEKKKRADSRLSYSSKQRLTRMNPRSWIELK